MKSNFNKFIILLALVVTCTTMVFAQGTTITLLHVNDTHSHLDAVGPKDANLDGTLGGIAKAATIIGTVRATEENVLLLHAGDIFQGDPMFNTYFGVPELQLMAQLGFDAMTIGNHEFGYGPDALDGVISTAFAGGSFPLLSANLDMSAYPALETWITPSVIKTVGGVKIGIFGMTVPNDLTTFSAPVIILDDLLPIAQKTANDLRSAGAQVVICLSHLGIYNDRLVAAADSRIDFIVGGHDHNLFLQPLQITNAVGKTVQVFQAGDHYKHIGKLHFTVADGKVTVNDYTMIDVNASIPAEPTVQAVVNELKNGVVATFGDVYHTVIGTSQFELSKKFNAAIPLRDTPLGNFVTDAFRNKTGTDLAITALGLISESIPAGKIVGADVFRSLSYGFDPATGLGFQLATVDISGAELVKGMEIGLSQLEIGDDIFLQFSGLRFKYDPAKSVGQRVILTSIHLDRKRFNPAAHYSLTINTGILMLLGSLGVEVGNVQVLPDFEYNVVRDQIAMMKKVNYHSEGRIREMMENALAKGMVGAEKSSPAPTTAMLLGNFPNPFNPATAIRYNVAGASHVTLKIYDIMGREVVTIVDRIEQPGEHSATWDASGFASGMYYYRLTAGTSTEIKKMLLMK